MTKEVRDKAMRDYRREERKLNTPQYLRDVGKRLREIREKKGITASEVARLLGCKSYRSVTLQEEGRNITLVQLKKFCDALDCELKDLFK